MAVNGAGRKFVRGLSVYRSLLVGWLLLATMTPVAHAPVVGAQDVQDDQS